MACRFRSVALAAASSAPPLPPPAAAGGPVSGASPAFAAMSLSSRAVVSASSETTRVKLAPPSYRATRTEGTISTRRSSASAPPTRMCAKPAPGCMGAG
eukprot:277721-Prorocentrum_minimum.AAC.1